jgi:hypothetical protein
MELVNDIFNTLEEHFVNCLSQEANENMLDHDLNSSIAYRKAIIRCSNVSGEYVTSFKLHALIIEKSGQFKVLHPSISKAVRQIRHVDIYFNLCINMLPRTDDNEFLRNENILEELPGTKLTNT